ncbi:LysR substrate-binding domain-containing protein [Bosea sp. (in: a-proteobacteria)]|uniref:LysR substrate-binding domain-containing protein n=1 Tax=Bosea sp. (in: a-proteobacteria) TaxID=1871050 RepID=UPI0026285EA0|nr:LysR substrate-binding domain-containing protein [Bosea sp. (in: a-proteobacteria)]MCO5089582.1 LysR substrate-binding domain-containing protein [Bosea sp. (in: a-proteobacteria)]
MELRQLRYFVRVVELGSISRAADDMNCVSSTLSQQITKLESELSTRLLQRTSRGIAPTEAGLEFFREAQLSLRHADNAAGVAQQARRSGRVSIGFTSTTAAVLGAPLLQRMQARYPDVLLHLVEGGSGHLSGMLNARRIDLAVLFDIDKGWRWSVTPLVQEKLFVIDSALHPIVSHHGKTLSLSQLKDIPLLVPSTAQGLRRTLDAVFSRERIRPRIVAEIDSLSLLLDGIERGLGAAFLPWAAVARTRDGQSRFRLIEVADVLRASAVCALSDDELTLPALAARTALIDCARDLTKSGEWKGTRLSLHES